MQKQKQTDGKTSQEKKMRRRALTGEDIEAGFTEAWEEAN